VGPAALAALKATVEFEDTRNRGTAKGYRRVAVPGGGSLFPAYELNASYVDCDVYVSLAKLKNHRDAGVTLSMKNNFGITPTSLYGGSQPDENRTSNRGTILHAGTESPAAGLPQEIDPASPRRATFRVPRHIVDAVGIRPIDLAVIDGIETVSGGEGPWHRGLARQTPRLLLAGRNPVCTDAIATAAMGYDPLAAPGTGPFPVTTTWRSPPGAGWARTTRSRSRCAGCRSGKPPTRSGGSLRAATCEAAAARRRAPTGKAWHPTPVRGVYNGRNS
jgi:hypothetical protein